MKIKVFIALCTAVFSVLLHGYLALEYYPLKLGFATGESLCKISAKFDCRAVAASSFSSIFGLPLSVLGFSTNLILFLMILLAWWGFSAQPLRLFRFAFYLSAMSLAGSIVMAGISLTQMTVYCLFCILLYALSILGFESLRRIQPVGFRSAVTDVRGAFAGAWGALVFFALIPATAFAVHHVMLSQYGAEELQRIVDNSIGDWQGMPAQDFSSVPPLMVAGPSRDKAAMVLTEFADFRCSHCRAAAPSVDAFVKSHPDVRMEFYAFPLDGECNKAMPSSNGISCGLAEAAYCAETLSAGWKMHEVLFAHFEENVSLNSKDAVLGAVQKYDQEVGLAPAAVTACLQSNDTFTRVSQMADLGAKAGVDGTPTFFVNDRKLLRGQLLSILEKAYSISKSQKP
jgi:protein-disulfide isomerase/uncharacterized membrane protein